MRAHLIIMGAYHWSSSWSPYDIENMQAKAIGMDAGFCLYLHPDNVERMGEKDACMKAFRDWQVRFSLHSWILDNGEKIERSIQ